MTIKREIDCLLSLNQAILPLLSDTAHPDYKTYVEKLGQYEQMSDQDKIKALEEIFPEMRFYTDEQIKQIKQQGKEQLKKTEDFFQAVSKGNIEDATVLLSDLSPQIIIKGLQIALTQRHQSVIDLLEQHASFDEAVKGLKNSGVEFDSVYKSSKAL